MFKKGDKKLDHSGRRKGVPNKRTVLVGEILAAHNISLVDQILARLKELEMLDQVKTLVALLPYVYSRQTNIQVSGIDGEPIKIDHTRRDMREVLKDPRAIEAMALIADRLNVSKDK